MKHYPSGPVLNCLQVKREGLSQKIQNAKIDYDDIPGMVHELERHKIHTIISAIGLVSDETSRSQLNLIEAAEKSAHTKRFVPSEYSFIQTAQYVGCFYSRALVLKIV